ncbi:MAG: hypothetical protein LH629_04250, partial [Ignavibacteria bacterium]|nr:hypothetical protein [Ignavibacteria bacterium]
MYQKYRSDDVHDMEKGLDSKVMLHTMGQNISSDMEVLSRAHDPELKINPEDYPYIYSYENSDYMFAGKGTVDNNQELYFAPKKELASGKINWKPLCTKDDKITRTVTYKNDIYLLSSKDASNFK